MASALMGGLVKARAVPSSSSIAVSEPYTPMREKHLKNGFAATTSNAEVVQRSDTIVLAVKPDVIPAVLRECAAAVGTAKLVVSIAAGVPLRTLEGATAAGRARRARDAQPAVPRQRDGRRLRAGQPRDARRRRAREGAPRLRRPRDRGAREADGRGDRAVGLGPAYGFVMIEALADAGVRAGLPRPTALTLAAQTMKGAAAMVLETGKHPGQLKDDLLARRHDDRRRRGARARGPPLRRDGRRRRRHRAVEGAVESWPAGHDLLMNFSRKGSSSRSGRRPSQHLTMVFRHLARRFDASAAARPVAFACVTQTLKTMITDVAVQLRRRPARDARRAAHRRVHRLWLRVDGCGAVLHLRPLV